MDSDEQDICNYLKSWPRQFISSREICLRAGGKRRFSEDPHWANQVLIRMAERGILETDTSGHFRLKPKEKAGRHKRWVSPQIRKILKESGKKFEGITDEDE